MVPLSFCIHPSPLLIDCLPCCGCRVPSHGCHHGAHLLRASTGRAVIHRITPESQGGWGFAQAAIHEAALGAREQQVKYLSPCALTTRACLQLFIGADAHTHYCSVLCCACASLHTTSHDSGATTAHPLSFDRWRHSLSCPKTLACSPLDGAR